MKPGNDAQRTFELEEAELLLPEVRRLTAAAVDEIDALVTEAEAADEDRRQALAKRMQQRVAAWAQQIETLGAEAKGMWLVDFDSGAGFYWCWQFPEESIEYLHDHASGFGGRRLIDPGVVH